MLQRFSVIAKDFQSVKVKAPEEYARIFDNLRGIYFEILKSLSEASKVEDMYRLQGQSYILSKLLSLMEAKDG